MPSEKVLARGKRERVADYGEALSAIRAEGVAIDAIALKAVHGGPKYRGTFRVDDGVVAALRDYLPAAPVHNAIYLDAIRSFKKAMPDIPIVAAFETEFHATMPAYASTYGVPGDWRENHGIARYGFHGASHQYIAERVKANRLVSCHLGGSSSICAVRGGKSMDTTMGFSPQSGLENATRHGDLDVFAVLYMMDRTGMSTADVRRSLAGLGGLAGLSGIAGGDVRDLEAAAEKGNPHASARAGRIHLPGAQDHRRLCGGAGRHRFHRLHRRDRREFGPAARRLLPRPRVPRRQDRPGTQCSTPPGSEWCRRRIRASSW